ncbi:MAG: PaaI family thioesterase [Nitriliruptorales bacterium]|nr:PaaI family thioesterase [Nitriliruptorales bacterium]
MGAIGDTLTDWMGTDEHAEGPRGLVHDLADELRGVAEAIAFLDPESCTEADLEPLVAQAASLRTALGALPDLSEYGSATRAPVPASLLHERSPISGHVNPVAAPLHFEYFDDRVVARAVFGRQYEGPAGGVHGGVVAAAFDEILGVAQMLSGYAGYTASLKLDYRAITPIEQEIVHEAAVLDIDGRKLRLWARSTCEDKLLVESEGLFVIQSHLPSPVGPDRDRDPDPVRVAVAHETDPRNIEWTP